MKKFAAVFPGQGSQSVGMMKALLDSSSVVKDVFEEASEILSYDTKQMALEGPLERLNETQITQPLLLTAGVACFRAFSIQCDDKPFLLAGHSLGEYSALVAAGSLSFKAALELVNERAKAMQTAVPLGEGAMAAVIGLDDETIVRWCQEHSSVSALVSPVNFNAPGQVVIAGHAHAIEKAIEPLKALGAKRVLLLPVSVPSHCALMLKASAHLNPYIEQTEISVPQISVVQNVDAAPHFTVTDIKSSLVKQLSSPVRWVASMNYCHDQGVEAIFEMGPGQVLCGLQKRINKSVKPFALGTPEGIQEALSWINEG